MTVTCSVVRFEIVLDPFGNSCCSRRPLTVVWRDVLARCRECGTLWRRAGFDGSGKWCRAEAVYCQFPCGGQCHRTCPYATHVEKYPKIDKEMGASS